MQRVKSALSGKKQFSDIEKNVTFIRFFLNLTHLIKRELYHRFIIITYIYGL